MASDMTHDRRQILALLAGVLALPGANRHALAQSPAMSRTTAFAFSFKGLDGSDIRLAEHSGRPILVVNTASLCGYTPQYSGLSRICGRVIARVDFDRRRSIE